MSILEVIQGLQEQGEDEKLSHKITTTNWASNPTSTAVVAYDETANNDDVTSAVYPTNSPSESGDIITLSLLRNLTVGHTYRIEVKFTVGSNIYECYFKVKAV